MKFLSTARNDINYVHISFGLVLLFLFIFCSPSFAQEAGKKSFQGIEFLTGYSHGVVHTNPDTKANFNTVPFLAGFDFDLKGQSAKLGFNPAALFQFQIEPHISHVFQPEHNVEFGNSFAFKLGFLPDTRKFQPYAKAGAGFLYTTLHTREQSTQFDFSEYAGAGAHYFFNKTTAFTLEGRFRHISNANIRKPNRGINSYFILSGIAYRF